jgi:hypothetical protein
MLVILDPEQWMDLRRFRVLHAAGVPIAEIARETGHDWKTVKKYLADDAPSCPPAAPPRAGTQPRMITPFLGLVDAWLRADITPQRPPDTARSSSASRRSSCACGCPKRRKRHATC